MARRGVLLKGGIFIELAGKIDALLTDKTGNPHAEVAQGAGRGGLAMAVASMLFGPGSGTALAAVGGVLLEVPVMLSVCNVCNRTRDWFGEEAAPGKPVWPHPELCKK